MTNVVPTLRQHAVPTLTHFPSTFQY